MGWEVFRGSWAPLWSRNQSWSRCVPEWASRDCQVSGSSCPCLLFLCLDQRLLPFLDRPCSLAPSIRSPDHASRSEVCKLLTPHLVCSLEEDHCGLDVNALGVSQMQKISGCVIRKERPVFCGWCQKPGSVAGVNCQTHCGLQPLTGLGDGATPLSDGSEPSCCKAWGCVCDPSIWLSRAAELLELGRNRLCGPAALGG